MLNGPATGANVADIGIEQRAIRANQATVGVDLLLRAGRCGQLRMIPYGDVQQVARTDAVLLGLIGQEFGRYACARLCRGIHGQQFRCDLDQLDAAAFGRIVIDDAAGIHVLARGEHAALQGEGGEHCDRQGADHEEGLR
ncbi:hypothetical protein D9M68_625030 [compost metagenome]